VLGLTVTEMGTSVTTPDADLVGSAWLVAVTVTVCWAAMIAGAAYSPPVLTVPTPAGFIDQITAVSNVLPTTALNCCVPPPGNVAVAGVTPTETGGSSVTVAEADFVLSAWLVAETATVCWLLTVAGAV
jgi:hypothetical protein